MIKVMKNETRDVVYTTVNSSSVFPWAHSLTACGLAAVCMASIKFVTGLLT